MSIMHCDNCAFRVDTDYDVESLVEMEDGRVLCERCREDLEEDDDA